MVYDWFGNLRQGDACRLMVVFSETFSSGTCSHRTLIVGRTSCNHYATKGHPFLDAIASILGLAPGR